MLAQKSRKSWKSCFETNITQSNSNSNSLEPKQNTQRIIASKLQSRSYITLAPSSSQALLICITGLRLFLLLSCIDLSLSYSFSQTNYVNIHNHMSLNLYSSSLGQTCSRSFRAFGSFISLRSISCKRSAALIEKSSPSSSLGLNNMKLHGTAPTFTSVTHTTPTRTFRDQKLLMSSSASSNFDENDNIDALSQTPLGLESATHLLDGLDVYTVYSDDEQKHPISVYGIHSKHQSDEFQKDGIHRKPILLLHGRTWSSVPVYHLLGGQNSKNCNNGHGDGDGEQQHSRSLMESLYEKGLQPYAMDFRGFGGTPSDETNAVTPNTCVCDVGYVLDFITRKHAKASTSTEGDGNGKHSNSHLPTLLGWSQGALVAQLFAQKHSNLISKLILYGSIYDPLVSYPPMPLYVNGTDSATEERVKNTFNAAIEDFTIEGSIPPEPATKFAHAALQSDPYKAKWTYLSQFNNVDPARVAVPTLIVAGDQDPYAPMRVQVSLFENLGRGADRTWSIIADADHAVHLLDDGRDRFINIVTSFVENGKKGETLN